MTIRTWRWVASAFLFACPLVPAQADDCPAAKTQLELDECAGRAFDKADTALNATYKTVMDRLAGEAGVRKSLVAAQKAWLGFRDGECDFESSSTIGGSIHPMIVSQCRTKLTQARTQSLRALLTCEEGDLSCPLPPK